MNRLAGSLLLTVIWGAATEQFSVPNLAFGLLLGYGILVYTNSGRGRHTAYFRRAWLAPLFGAFVLWELCLATLRVAYNVMGPLSRLQPGIIAVPLSARTDLEIMALANLITLTPGTCSLDVSRDRSVLFVHVMHIDDPEAVRSAIKDGFERPLLRMLR